MSDDGQHGITVIAFIGSVFSPYYRWARRWAARRGEPPPDPRDHCAINVALYGPRGKRWAMTERRRGSLERDATTLGIGRSQLHWTGDGLTVDLDELAVPWLGRIRGRIRLHPQALVRHVEVLDATANHVWQPIAPRARVEVELAAPALRWSGDGYLDSNGGDAPLEDAIRQWHWSRSGVGNSTAVLYDVIRRDGSTHAVALRFDPQGMAEPFEAPPFVSLPPSRWGVARASRGESGEARIVRTLEDTPFYARSMLEARLCSERTQGVHESLDLDRFIRPVVQCMLPFRMPRASR